METSPFPGLPTRLAKVLVARGYRSGGEVKRATDHQLAALWGIGWRSLAIIRKHYPWRGWDRPLASLTTGCHVVLGPFPEDEDEARYGGLLGIFLGYSGIYARVALDPDIAAEVTPPEMDTSEMNVIREAVQLAPSHQELAREWYRRQMDAAEDGR